MACAGHRTKQNGRGATEREKLLCALLRLERSAIKSTKRILKCEINSGTSDAIDTAGGELLDVQMSREAVAKRRTLPHTTSADNVHEYSYSVCRRRAVVRVGSKQDGGAGDR
ncbi:MAG TPA: hypothetical protein VED16_02140 [Candidatus Acidoferrum sp.]|nr:hypothetical protein [Candidatus Acidoferrum sp.]